MQISIAKLLNKSGILFLGVASFSTPYWLSNCGNSNLQKSNSDTTYFLNLNDTVDYVGMNECKVCHSEIHSTFIHTGMGQSFGLANKEKSVGDFKNGIASNSVYDSILNLYYKAHWEQDSLFIYQYTKDPISQKVDYQRKEYIPFIIGSGQHTNSHFWLDGEYVYQAPLTFYSQKGIWDLPPGFRTNNSGFNRKIEMECMSCHNAMPTPKKEARNLFSKIPLGIDCERCHGPGELHVAQKKKGIIIDTRKFADRSIVNPKRLPYSLQVDICQRCHLQGNNVLKDGKSFADFRPGMALKDVFEVYMPKYENKDYFVMAGHSDRFQQSECFIQSNKGKNTESYNAQINFTCINCHNPHISVRKTQTDRFNNSCKSCHYENSTRSSLFSCSQSHTEKANCVSCHMPPSSAEDIPHVMVHDHKIQRPLKNKMFPEKGKLLGLYSVNNKNPDNRTKVKAYLSYFEKFDPNELYLKKALNYLQIENNNHEEWIHYYWLKRDWQGIIKHAKLIDTPRNEWSNYRIAKAFDSENDIKTALNYYQKTLEFKPKDLDFVAEYANALIRSKQINKAKNILEKQLKLAKKHELTWLNRGTIYFLEEDYSNAKRCWQTVLKLNPNQKLAHLYLSELYLKVGETNKSKYHVQLSQ